MQAIATVRGPRGEILDRRDLPLADYAPRVIRVRADQSARSALVVRHRAVGIGVIRFFRIAVTLHDEHLRFDVCAFVLMDDRIGLGADDVPDLTPHDPERLAERLGMLATDDGFVGIVVEVGEVRSPSEPERLA